MEIAYFRGIGREGVGNDSKLRPIESSKRNRNSYFVMALTESPRREWNYKVTTISNDFSRILYQ